MSRNCYRSTFLPIRFIVNGGTESLKSSSIFGLRGIVLQTVIEFLEL
jgi:hypothetical protein